MPLEEIIVGRSSKDIEKYGKKGCVFLGKMIVGRGAEAHLTNPIIMDVMRPHVIGIFGKRGSGKSYTAAVIAEEIMDLPEDIRKNLSVILIDTMGIYWSMKEPNDEALLLLKDWGMKPKGYLSRNIVPVGLADFYRSLGIPFDSTFAIKPSELSAADWCLAFEIDLYSMEGILIQRALGKLEGEYGIEDIIKTIERDKRAPEKEKLALGNRFNAAQGWGIFAKEATPIEEFLKPGIATVLDVSLQGWAVRNLMLGILARKVYEARIAARREEEMARIAGKVVRKVPLTWFIMDEAHNFLPAEGKTAATDPLLLLVRQGRQPGISTVFITQRPAKLHETALAQADFIISHRLTAKPDLDALSTIMQAYALEDIKKMIGNLPKPPGSAVILDDVSERLFNIQVRPRMSWHAGGTPVALAPR